MNQQGKLGKGALIVLLVVILGGALGWLGYYFGTRNNDKAKKAEDSSQQTTVEATADAQDESSPVVDEAYCDEEGWTAYTNELIGLEFCYPVTWGAPNMTAPQASASVAGSGYEIAFSAYDTVVSSITSDYQNTIGRGGRCEDPTNVAPDFSMYREAWVQESTDPDLGLASRYHIKKDGVYLVSETVDSFYGGMCFVALVKQSGTAYPVIKVALRRPMDPVDISAHVANPEALFSTAERSDFIAVVDSVRKPE